MIIPPLVFPALSKLARFFQRRWRLHRDDDDEGHPAPRREGRLEPAGHLQVVVRD